MEGGPVTYVAATGDDDLVASARARLEADGGVLVDQSTGGDPVVVAAFGRVGEALRSAHALVTLGSGWRAAVHTLEVEPDGGPAAAATAIRFLGGAREGQVLVSSVARALAEGTEPDGVAVPRGLIGRTAELATVAELLRAGPLVTLTGIGGAGKTRLALEVAAIAAERFPGGTFVVDLSAVRAADEIEDALARAMDAPLARSPFDVLAGRDEATLVVVDNCEHVLAGATALVERIVEIAPSARVLTTSRVVLGLEVERVVTVPPLQLPPVGAELSVAEASGFEAVALFAEQARRARPEFRLTEANLAPTVELCRRLEGLPLGIELAAAQVRIRTPREILAELEAHLLGLGAGDRRAVEARQTTIRASVDWSHRLLPDEARRLLHRLSVFVADFDLDAVAVVGGLAPLAGVDAAHLLSQLVDASLVVAREVDDQMRFRLLEPVRAFAAELLVADGDGDAVRDAHLGWAAAALASVARAGSGAEAWAATHAVDGVWPNVAAALVAAPVRGRGREAVRAVAGALPFWLRTTHVREARHLVDGVLETVGDLVDDASVDVAVAQIVLSWDVAPAVSVGAAEALLARDLPPGHDAALGWAECAVATLGRPDRGHEARARLERAVAHARAAGDEVGLVYFLGNLAALSASHGQPERARAALQELLALTGATGDGVGEAWSMWSAWLTTAEDLPRAASELAEVCGRLDAVAGGGGRARIYASTATVAVTQGELVESSRFVDAFWTALEQEAWDIGRPHGHAVGALLALARGGLDEARREVSSGEEAAARLGSSADVGFLDVVRAEVELASGGDPVSAVAAAEAAVRVAERSDHRGNLAWALEVLARASLAAGDRAGADRAAHRGLELLPVANGRATAADLLFVLAELELDGGDTVAAARLLGAASAEQERQGACPFPGVAARRSEVAVSVESALGADGEGAIADGRSLGAAGAIALARRGRGRRRRPSQGWESLTPTEWSVIDLVGEGLPSKEIAKRLLMSPRTVSTHLTHVFTKLGVSNRAELAVAVVRRSAPT
jgi:predicted ATPase/DNA-binding CsgD family transcriptional regulator